MGIRSCSKMSFNSTYGSFILGGYLTFIFASCCRFLMFLFLEWKCFNISSSIWGSCISGLCLSHRACTTRGDSFIACSIVSKLGKRPILPAWASRTSCEMQLTISWMRKGHFLMMNNLQKNNWMKSKLVWNPTMYCMYVCWNSAFVCSVFGFKTTNKVVWNPNKQSQFQTHLSICLSKNWAFWFKYRSEIHTT